MNHLEKYDWASSSSIVPSLNGIRGVSVFIVLAGHMLIPHSMVGISALGLKTFFFLSGFLITRLLLAECKSTSTISLRKFYFRRFVRLYPVIIVYVAVAAAVLALRGVRTPTIEVASVFLYFVNYLVIHYEAIEQQMTLPVGMLWSLSVEEHFYIFAPIAILLLRGAPQRILVLAVGICLTSLLLRLIYIEFDLAVPNTLEIYWRSETRFDSIAYGMVLACLPDFPLGRRIVQALATKQAFILGLAVLCLSYSVRGYYFQNSWRFSIQGLALIPIFCSVVFAKPFPKVNAALNSGFWVWMGKLSYSLYVWHGGISFFFGSWLEILPGPIQSWAGFVLAFAFAIGSYYVVERPILRFFHRRDSRARRNLTSPEPAAKIS